MMDFKTIDYLKSGTANQIAAYNVLTENQILSKLASYDPILTGTFPLNINLENSDLDIICYTTDHSDFKETLLFQFNKYKNFQLKESSSFNSIIAQFELDNFLIEIFGQATQTTQQLAYRHMIIEYHLLMKYGENFRLQIIELKKQGYKTEPAFAKLLGLTGEPYIELLQYEDFN